MTSALLYAALLGTLAIIIWLAARKAARAEVELDYVKRAKDHHEKSNKIVRRYVNMSSLELSERVREKRSQQRRRMRSQD